MNALKGHELNAVLAQNARGVQGSLVGGSTVRQYGMLDTAISHGTPDTMSFISVVMAMNPQ